MHRLVIALTTGLTLVGVTVIGAYLLLGAASDRAAEIAPADTVAYVNVYLDPSAGQQISLRALISRFPGFRDPATLDDKIDEALQNLFAMAELDYRREFKPWLGGQVAFGFAPPDDAGATGNAVAYLGVRDREAAEVAIADLLADGVPARESETYEGVRLVLGERSSYAFIGGMLVVSDTPARLREVVDVERGTEPSLASTEAYQEALARLPADHLASGYVDLPAAAALAGAVDPAGYGTLGMALVAEADGLRLSGSLPVDVAELGDAQRDLFELSREPSPLTERMPPGTQAEVVLFGLAQVVAAAEEELRAADPDGVVDAGLDQVRALAAFGLGIDLDADVLPLFDRDAAVGFAGVSLTEPRLYALLRPSDPVAAEASLERIVTGLERRGVAVERSELEGTPITVVTVPDAPRVAYAVRDGVVLVAAGEALLGELLRIGPGDASLADGELYRRAFSLAGGRAGNELFVEIGTIVNLVALVGGIDADTRELLEPLEALAVTTPARGDLQELHIVVTIR